MNHTQLTLKERQCFIAHLFSSKRLFDQILDRVAKENRNLLSRLSLTCYCVLHQFSQRMNACDQADKKNSLVIGEDMQPSLFVPQGPKFKANQQVYEFLVHRVGEHFRGLSRSNVATRLFESKSKESNLWFEESKEQMTFSRLLLVVFSLRFIFPICRLLRQLIGAVTEPEHAETYEDINQYRKPVRDVAPVDARRTKGHFHA